MAYGMDVWSSNEGGESAEVGGNIGVFELLDGGHGESVVVNEKWYDEMGAIARGWASKSGQVGMR